MATKNSCISFHHRKQQQVFGGGAFDSAAQYTTLNLNHTNQSFLQGSLCSKSHVTNESSRKVGNNDLISENNLHKSNKNSLLLDPNSIKVSSYFYDEKKFQCQKQNNSRYKGYQNNKLKNSKNSNNSTLSLHISAYENSIDSSIFDSNCDDTVMKMKKKNKTKQSGLILSYFDVQAIFELPRQQQERDNKTSNPEVMQFKASQKLHNPNQAPPSGSTENLLKTNASLKRNHKKPEDEIYPSMAEKDAHFEQWLDVAYAFYLQAFLKPTEIDNTENRIVCVPHIISTLELFAQSSTTADSYIKPYIYFNKSNAFLERKNLLGKFLDQWEKNIQESARPGNFFTQRRLLVHHGFSKSYSLETFATLNILGIEVKILFNEGSDIIRWLKNSCKMKQLPDIVGNPFNLWPKKIDPNAIEKREHNICKCPIYVAVSQFEFPIKTNALDAEKLYKISFRVTPELPKIDVIAFRIICSKLSPLRFIQISQKCRIIELPSAAEHLLLYIIENCDEIIIKNGQELKQYVMSMENASTDNEIESLYIPKFFEYPKSALNVANGLQHSLKDLDKLFTAGAFGDLAYDGAEPSISKAAASLQHYNHFELMKLPDSSKSNISTLKHDEKYHKISQPFMFIVWDTSSKIPLYIARICMPDCENGNGLDGLAKDKAATTKPQNKWNVLSFFKKKPKVKKEQQLETVEIPAATITQSQKLDP